MRTTVGRAVSGGCDGSGLHSGGQQRQQQRANLSQSVNLLDAVLRQAEASNLAAACNGLNAFINQMQARAGKTLTAGAAAALVDEAQQVQTALGCP